MTSELLAAGIGAGISWLIENVPAVDGVLDKLGKYKRTAFAAVFVLAPVGFTALACGGVSILGASCPADAQGYVDAALMGAIAFGASQFWHAEVNTKLP